jgi:hypothetical protein
MYIRANRKIKSSLIIMKIDTQVEHALFTTLFYNRKRRDTKKNSLFLIVLSLHFIPYYREWKSE